ncbi:MAG: phosphoadenosine phosphosulfate reductase family protein [Thermoplasmata archaeon]
MGRRGRLPKESGLARAPEEKLSLAAKIRVAEAVMDDALTRFHHPVVMWTGGKDSMLALWYVREECGRLEVPLPPVLFIDHGLHFDETWELLDQVTSTWGLKKIVGKNADVLTHASEHASPIRISELSVENRREAERTGYGRATFPYSLGDLLTNHLLKTVPMNDAIVEHQFDGVVTGIRWDEDEARSRERFISPREEPPHARIHPILHFTEREVWMETLKHRLPLHPLYEQGWRSIDGKYDSVKVGDAPAWEQDLEGTEERGGRAQDKELLMERLRQLGYM